MLENSQDTTLEIKIEDDGWHISSGPISVGYAKKMLSRHLLSDKQGCTEEEVSSFLPKFEEALKKAQALYPTVVVIPLVDKEWIGVKLHNEAKTWEDNVDQQRTGLSEKE